MPLKDGDWFTEVCDEAGSAFSLRVTEKLYTERSSYQTIEVYATSHFGNLLVRISFITQDLCGRFDRV